MVSATVEGRADDRSDWSDAVRLDESAEVLPTGNESQIREWLESLNASDLSVVYRAALTVAQRSREQRASDPPPASP